MILVTGANGFVGRALLSALDHYQIEARPFVGRINNLIDLRKNLEGVETVIHLATAEFSRRRKVPRNRRSPFPRRDEALHHIDVLGTQRLMQEAESLGVNHVIYVSRLNAEKESAFPVLRAKGMAEQIVRKSNLPTTIMRVATLFGRDDHFLNTISWQTGWQWPLAWLPGGGRSLIQPLWVEDLVKCLITVSDPLDLQGYRGRTYELAGDERLHYFEAVALVLATTGRRRLSLSIPNRLARTLIWALFSWRRPNKIDLYFLDHLRTPEIAPLDIVHQTFGFHPTRMREQITYLRR